MASINEILGKNINSVKELKSAINELQNSLIGVDTESEQFKTTSEQLAAAQAELVKVTKAGKDENVAATDSLVGMRNEYKALYDQYKLLTEEQRNSDFGQEMQASLESLSSKINDTQQGVGNFAGNVGRYASSITQAFNGMGASLGALQGPLKLASGGAKTFGQSLKALAANPIILVITVLVAILMKVAEHIKKNEELTNRLKEAFSAFQPILDLLSNALDFLAGILVKIIEFYSKLIEKVLSLIPGMKEQIKQHKELAKATNELTKAQREASVVNSQKEAEIERLREEASDVDDVVEKRKLLEEAKRIQAEVDQKNIELAKEELRIMEEYAAKTANSAEENDKLAEAQRKVNEAIAQGERNMRMYNKQIDQTTKKTGGAAGGGTNWAKKAKELHNQLIEDGKEEVQKLTEKYEKEKKLLIKYHYDTKLLTKKYQEELLGIQNDIQQKRLDTERNYNNRILDTQKAQNEALEQYFSNFQKKSILIQIDKYEQEIIPKLYDLEETIEATFQDIQGMIDRNTYLTLNQVLKSIIQYGDMTEVASMDYLLERVDELAAKFPEKINDKLAKAMKDIIKQLGPDEIAQLFGPIQDATNELNKLYGLSIKNFLTLDVSISNASIQLEKLQGQLQQMNVDEAVNNAKIQQTFNEWTALMEQPLEAYKVLVLENTSELLEVERDALYQELIAFSGTTEQKIAMQQRYYDIIRELKENDLALTELNSERTAQMADSLIKTTDSTAQALSTVKSSFDSLVDSQLKAGKIDEAEAKKKKKRLQTLENIQTAFAVATIAADAAAGIFSVWKGYATETGVINAETAAAAGPAAAAVKTALDAKSLVSAIAKTTALATTATAQITAAIAGQIASNNNFAAENEGGGGAGVAVMPSLIDSSPYSYTRTVQTQEEEDAINNRPIYVTVTDIEEGLGQRVKVTNESSF